jgi:CHASE3 domain sensor protein
MIHNKMVLGKLIGFIPLYAVVFLYLMAPMLYVSAQEMQHYYQQMQTF